MEAIQKSAGILRCIAAVKLKNKPKGRVTMARS
jgi:hypothetical protein